MVENIGIHIHTLTIADIRRIAYYYIPMRGISLNRQSIMTAELYICLKLLGIGRGNSKCIVRYIPSLNISLRQCLLNADGYATTTSTDIKDAQLATTNGVDYIHHSIHYPFGLGTWNEHTRLNIKTMSAEPSPTKYILYRLLMLKSTYGTIKPCGINRRQLLYTTAQYVGKRHIKLLLKQHPC